MSVHAVHVSNISESTTEKHLTDFFTFCGKIESIDFSEEKRTATIQFQKPSSAKTALMLDGGLLDGAHLIITSEHEPSAKDEAAHGQDGNHHHIDQSDKPRAGIAAEYLARGYTLSDQILQRAIELDKQHGISNRFLSYMQNLDTTLGAKAFGPEKTISGKAQETLQSATQQAKAVDEQRGITKSAGDYYVRALSSTFGQKVKAFYTETSKQVLDIHEEARRIHESHKATAGSGQQQAQQHDATDQSEKAPSTEVSAHAPDATVTGGAPKTTEAPTVV